MMLQDAIVIWTPDTDQVPLVHKDTHWHRTNGDRWMTAWSLTDGQKGSTSTQWS